MPGKPGQGFDIEGGFAPTAPWRTQWLVSSRSESERSIVSIAEVRNPVAVVAGRHYSLTKASASLNDRYAPPFGQAPMPGKTAEISPVSIDDETRCIVALDVL